MDTQNILKSICDMAKTIATAIKSSAVSKEASVDSSVGSSVGVLPGREIDLQKNYCVNQLELLHAILKRGAIASEQLDIYFKYCVSVFLQRDLTFALAHGVALKVQYHLCC